MINDIHAAITLKLAKNLGIIRSEIGMKRYEGSRKSLEELTQEQLIDKVLAFTSIAFQNEEVIQKQRKET